MLIVLSPAKALDYETPAPIKTSSQPSYVAEASELIALLRQKSRDEIAALMKLSESLAELNVGRYQRWQPKFTQQNSKQAILAFNGDVYDGLQASELEASDFDWAQQHIRILSGLYGLLRPLDLMQAYRLEMSSMLANPAGRNLYAYWGKRLAEALNTQLSTIASNGGERVLVNLASQEYFRAANAKHVEARIITPVFEDWKGGNYKVISFFAKKARGLMARYAITNRVQDVEVLKTFHEHAYRFDRKASTVERWVFRRKLTAP